MEKIERLLELDQRTERKPETREPRHIKIKRILGCLSMRLGQLHGNFLISTAIYIHYTAKITMGMGVFAVHGSPMAGDRPLDPIL